MTKMFRVVEKDLNTGMEKIHNYGSPERPWFDAEKAAYDHACILQEMADWGGKRVEIKVERIS